MEFSPSEHCKPYRGSMCVSQPIFQGLKSLRSPRLAKLSQVKQALYSYLHQQMKGFKFPYKVHLNQGKCMHSIYFLSFSSESQLNEWKNGQIISKFSFINTYQNSCKILSMKQIFVPCP